MRDGRQQRDHILAFGFWKPTTLAAGCWAGPSPNGITTPDPETGLLTEEYADVYGIPFSVISVQRAPGEETGADDRPKNHVRSLPERASMAIRFPVVEGYAFALRKNQFDVTLREWRFLVLEPNRDRQQLFLMATVGYKEGYASQQTAAFDFIEQTRSVLQGKPHSGIKFQIARLVLERLMSAYLNGTDAKSRVLRLQSRHQLSPKSTDLVDD